MTLRAFLIGIAAALFIAGFGYINNHVILLEPLESGHLIPISVVGVLLLIMLVLNPLLFRIRRSLAFRPAEVGLIIALMLIACSIPGRGLMEQFTPSMIMPIHWNKTYPSWQRNKLLDYVPSAMFAADKQEGSDAVESFVMGKGTPSEDIGIGDVPWAAWRKPLMVWLPLVLLTSTASICLVLVVQKQWVEHEQLPYPIATFMSGLMERGSDSAVGRLFRSRMFWLGFGLIFALRFWNGLYTWMPQELVPIKVRFDFMPVSRLWPMALKAPWAGLLFRPTIYPLVVGFSFFLASDVALSLGLCQFLFIPIAAVFVSYGVEMHSSYMAGGAMGWHRAGAYMAFALMIFYMGRRYYTQVLRRAVGGSSSDQIESHVVWACRGLAVALVLMTAILVSQGLDWTIAIITVGLVMIMFLGVSRISAETGMFFIHPRWQPLGVFLGLFGAYALGPKALIIVGLVCVVLSLDPSQSLMAYFTNALRMSTRLKLNPAKTAATAWGTYAAGLALATVVVLWAQYNHGCTKYGWSFQRVPTMSFRPADTAVDSLEARGVREESENLTPIQRLTRIQPETKFLWAAGTGFALVLLTSWLRLRLPWWPLHPILFLVWSSYSAATLHHSFLLGWFIKVMATKYGGQQIYHRLKPTMAGLIAGDLFGVFVFMIVGAIYYMVTGDPPVLYRVYPR